MSAAELSALSDVALSERFAVEVAGWVLNGFASVGETEVLHWVTQDNGSDEIKSLNFATSADAVLPFLAKCDSWQSFTDQGEWPEVTIEVWSPVHGKGEEQTFPRAACIALILAARAKAGAT